jgi:hypothetical protein
MPGSPLSPLPVPRITKKYQQNTKKSEKSNYKKNPNFQIREKKNQKNDETRIVFLLKIFQKKKKPKKWKSKAMLTQK